MLLTRDHFRNAVFERDNFLCVICNCPAQDAHHIIERRLFKEPHEFGGYFVNNGASVCGSCHIACEKTLISVEQVREAAGIKKKVLPSHLYDDQTYDKWGNIILENSQRLKGELFYDESVQKILSEVLHLFTHYVKYPRTYHLPWSLGMHDDDRMHFSTNQWQDKLVVITEKMDGENTTMYSDHIHARSIESKNHPSRTWIKNFWSQIAHLIPEGWRVCGENLYAKHSIGYNNLRSYFLGFSVWNDKNICLSWPETLEWFNLLEIEPVLTLWSGIYNESVCKSFIDSMDFEVSEGYVLRTQSEFSYLDFNKYVGKFVRPDHIKTTKHWMMGQEMIKNAVSV
jgi:hypothetical protein